LRNGFAAETQIIPTVRRNLHIAKESSAMLANLKGALNREVEPKFWHVVAGDDFNFALPYDDLPYLHVQVKGTKVLAFRLQGIKREVNWSGFTRFIGYALALMLAFLVLITLMRCNDTSTHLLCEHRDKLQFTAISAIFVYGFTRIMNKL
jgi:hypothetical protein